MFDSDLTDELLSQIEEEGILETVFREQMELVRGGIEPVRLSRPCTTGDGIVKIPRGEWDNLISIHDREAEKGRMVKFVPASGAASRMFKDWFKMSERPGDCERSKMEEFLADLPKYAFYRDIALVAEKHGSTADRLIGQGRFDKILEYVLLPSGLNYGHFPKALIKFHRYTGGNRTSLEEHMVEASMYIKDDKKRVRIHVTLSSEFVSQVLEFIKRFKPLYESEYHARFDVSVSVQHPSTNTAAFDMNKEPFRDSSERLIFRPGGHGALLKNLNELNGDIVFIKNIDNVVPDRLKPQTVLFKKILSGFLIDLQEKGFDLLERISLSRVSSADIEAAEEFCRNSLGIHTPPSKSGNPSLKERCAYLKDRLDRPLRVCGMVKNEGEPGGGPFWVEEADGTLSLQIIEKGQIDPKSKDQEQIWNSSTHFNPVDLVCGLRNFEGHKFDLQRFVNKKACLVSKKSIEGKDIMALELPGLWNGSMAYWNTVFVEVPLETFNPVKEVRDLLRPQHL